MLFFGSIQMAGQSQSPCGIFATTSTLPYWMWWLFFVVMRALMTGGMTVPAVWFDTAPHADNAGRVSKRDSEKWDGGAHRWRWCTP